MGKASDTTAVLRCKVAVCGSAGAGKTSLISLIKSNSAPQNYQLTSGVDVVVHTVRVPNTTTAVELLLFDTAGHAVFKDVVAEHVRDASQIMLVYDVTDAASFAACADWLDKVRQHRSDRDEALKGVLVAAKTDVPRQQHRVPEEKARAWAAQKGLTYFECTTSNHESCEKPFQCLANLFHDTYEAALARMGELARKY